MSDDAELLRRFIEQGSEAAFRELVGRRIDFVYAAALRQVGGDTHLAREVTQGVFIDVARKARLLAQRASITGWLYTSTRFAAAKALRSRVRRLNHETEAHAMQEILSAQTTADIAWDELRPVLDAALHELDERDREAILQRYFEGRSLAEVGAAVGLAENSARMRVDRALEKLRGRLARRGITSTAAALGVALANQPAIAAPVGLAASVAGAALAGAAVAGGSGLAVAWWLFEFMQTTKLALGTLGAIAAMGLGAYLGISYSSPGTAPTGTARATANDATLAALREENRGLKDALARQTAVSGASSPTTGVAATPDLAAAVATLEPMRLLAQLDKKKWVRPEMAFVDSAGKLTESFTGLFNLTPAEQAALQGTVDRAREHLAVLEQANATVAVRPDGKVEIKVKAFAAEGGEVYNELMRDFASTLGPERDEVYRSLGAEQVELALSRFGAAERTVTVSRKAPGEGAQKTDKLIVVRDETRTRGSSSTSSSDYKDLNEVATRIGTLVRLLPPNF